MTTPLERQAMQSLTDSQAMQHTAKAQRATHLVNRQQEIGGQGRDVAWEREVGGGGKSTMRSSLAVISAAASLRGGILPLLQLYLVFKQTPLCPSHLCLSSPLPLGVVK